MRRGDHVRRRPPGWGCRTPAAGVLPCRGLHCGEEGGDGQGEEELVAAGGDEEAAGRVGEGGVVAKPLLRPWVRHHHSGDGGRSGVGRA